MASTANLFWRRAYFFDVKRYKKNDYTQISGDVQKLPSPTAYLVCSPLQEILSKDLSPLLQIGGDLAQWSGNEDQRFHLGLMDGYATQHSNTRNTLSGNSSKASTSGYSTGLYGTYYQKQKDKSGLYVDS